MTGFLLTISFILHLLTLLAILIVWKKTDVSDQHDIERVKREMEDILLAYSTEMKEENDAFLEQLRNINEKKDALTHKQTSVVAPVDEGTSMQSSIKNKEYTPPVNEDKEQFGPSVIAEVFSLQQKGYTLEQIAKKLDKGKGEIELLMKFHQDRQ